ncbi:MAG: glycoside hydrolase family 65 protein, partial [Flavobacteriaceae bacterium]
AAFAALKSHTHKTGYEIVTYMQTQLLLNGLPTHQFPKNRETGHKITQHYSLECPQNETATLIKFGGYLSDRNHPKEKLMSEAEKIAQSAHTLGWDSLLRKHIAAWDTIWQTADIEIQGDIESQQAIRFNIFHLNQTYSGKDPGLNIGPKGFTGEKYGGSTYWDTEAYCLPFYMATKSSKVARNLLQYRYYHLEAAIKNASLLGFKGGAALYPMVTMNGEECHNEWEITIEEIHRNGAIR